VDDHVPTSREGLMDLVLDDLIRTSRQLAPARVLDGVTVAAARLGATAVAIWLNDSEHRALRSLADGEVAPIEGSVLGRCFSTDEDVVMSEGAGVRLLLPLIDGAECLRVLDLSLPFVDDVAQRQCGRLTALVAELIVTRGQYTDAFFRVRRGREMSLEAEMEWHLFRPLTFSIPEVALAAMAEPAYDVGGDAFDYAHNDGVLQIALFDAMGHGVQAALTATLAIGAYRHARRQGASLAEVSERVDEAVAQHRPSTFCTAILAELDTATGALSWIAAGHPPPMLVRARAVSSLECAPSVPVGVAAQFPQLHRAEVCTATLQPADRLLLYSDGCIEAATPSGEPFGEERLSDFLIREQSAGLGLGETVRRLSHAVLDHAGGVVADDATLALIEYRGV
jgi:hypothetical protein